MCTHISPYPWDNRPHGGASVATMLGATVPVAAAATAAINNEALCRNKNTRPVLIITARRQINGTRRPPRPASERSSDTQCVFLRLRPRHVAGTATVPRCTYINLKKIPSPCAATIPATDGCGRVLGRGYYSTSSTRGKTVSNLTYYREKLLTSATGALKIITTVFADIPLVIIIIVAHKRVILLQ